MSTERARGNQYRANRVCVDSYLNGVLMGRLYNPASDQEIAFRSMSQFLLGMEELLDRMNFPQSFAAARSFADIALGLSGGITPRTAEPVGTLATFVVRVLFRQNASWQGSVLWEETGREENFRSALELMLMMDGALKESGREA